MSHEIYYTSAPEGLKRGTSGFCTVAASDNIPRALWDRLETLSAYRHHFSVDAHGGSAPAGQNPVSFAHWILSITGKTHHVLSRVCDSGVDHTQRTNAFAHHLVLDTAEMDSAPGGPAWLLSQGVMAGSWDGRVGALSPARIPGGNPGARVCSAWANFTGDAGWGGHLADLFVKSPSRPVCILFSPGQDLLPLMAEAIALLPPVARWNVTFNTYFTSMPTSATCVWRCCLAGTPAAQVGLRYAANGLILDLTDRNRLPALPMGPLVTVARTGQAAPAPSRAIPAVPASPAARPTRAAPVPVGKGAKRPVVDPDDNEEELLEKQRAAVFEFTPSDEAQISGRASQDPYDLAEPMETATTLPTARGRKMPARFMSRADDALQEAEQEADRAAARRRKQVIYLFAGALGALALGTALVFLNGKKGGPPPEIPVSTRPKIISPVDVVTPEINPPTTVEVVTTKPVETQPVTVVQTQQVTPPIPLPPTRVFPEIVTLAAAIERPNIGGVGDRVQSFPLPANDFDRPASITSVHLHMPQAKADPAAPAPADNSYVSANLGTYTATAEVRATKPGVALTWKATGIPGSATEIAFIAFDRTRPGVELQWHTSQLLKNTELFSPLYWLLQSSSLELAATPAHEKNQRIAFRPFEPPVLSMNEPAITIPWPVDLPHDTSAVAPKGLPAGWEASWYTDWETKDPTLRSAGNALQVLKFRRPGPAGADAWFLLTFRPGLDKVESTLGKRMAADQSDLSKAQAELSQLEADIKDAQSRITPPDSLDKYPSGRDLLAKRDDAAQRVNNYKTIVAAYHDLAGFDVAFDQPDGLRLATVHFKQTDSP